MKLRLTKDTFITICITIMIFSSYLTLKTSGIISSFFNNFNEMFAIMIFLHHIKKKNHSNFEKKILALQMIFIAIGLTGSIINKYQPMNLVIKDMINCSKFIMTLLGVMSLYYTDNNEKVIYSLQKNVKKIIILFFALTIIDLIFCPSFLVHSTKKYGIYELSLIYYHPAILAQMLILFISILSFKNTNIRHKNTYILLCLLMLIPTFVTKAIGFAFIYLFISNYRILLKNKLLCFIIVLIATIGLYFIASDSIKMYYGSMENTARGKLTIGSIKIAEKYFPYGGGFGTYGSSSAVEKYSPLYEALGFKNVYGLGYSTTKYATDTFWPIIIGEFGYMGLIIYLVIIINLAKKSIQLLKEKSDLFITYTSLLAYLIICSTSSTSFYNPISVVYAIVMGICLAKYNTTKKTEKEN